MMNLDLNLLRTFDALMEQRSVTRAARHLGVTQPAVSHALGRLRRALGDPLFLRVQNGLQPTARAEEIAGGIRRGLAQFESALAPTTFDPAHARRHFTLAAGAYFCRLLIPPLVERIRREAPGVSLAVVPSGETLVPLLDQGAVDLALGVELPLPERIVVEPLYREKMVWIAAPDNPLVRDRRPLARIDEAARILIAPARPFDAQGKPGEDAAPPTDQVEWGAALADPARARNRITVYESQTAVALVAKTDLVARVSARVAALAAAKGEIALLDWLEDEGHYAIALIWHARQRADPGLAWLRATIRAVDAGG